MDKSNLLNYSYIQHGGVRFDILKFILAMFIVAMHSGLFPRWLLPIPRLAVPLFFVMTSFFFHLKLREAPTDTDRKSRLVKFVKRNLQLYMFWSVALLPIIIVLHYNWFSHGFMFAVSSILKSVFITGLFGASWFILASVYAVLIVYFLSKWLNNGWILLIALLVYVLALLDSNYGGVLSADAQEGLSSLDIRWSLNLPAALMWIVIGKYLAERPLLMSSPKLYPLIGLAAVAYYGEFLFIESHGWSVHTDCFVMSIPLITFIFASIGQAKDIKCRCTLWLRKSSIMVFCIHLSIIRILQLASSHCNLGLADITICTITLIISLSIVAMIIYLSENKKIRILQKAY